MTEETNSMAILPPTTPPKAEEINLPPCPAGFTQEVFEDPATGQKHLRLKIEIPPGELQKRSIFLAMPMYGGTCYGSFARSVADLTSECLRAGVKLVQHTLVNESLITRARNYCVDEFLRSDCTHLLFIDSDITFNARDVLSLLALSDPEGDYNVIGAAYPKKTIAWEKIKMAVDKGFADQNPEVLQNFVGDYVFNPRGNEGVQVFAPAEVLEIGTGFMMAQRKVFERFAEAFPHLLYRPDHVRSEHFDGSRPITAFFDCVIDRGYTMQWVFDFIKKAASGDATFEELKEEANAMLEVEKTASMRYLSEDYKFCQDVLRLGMKVWLCPWMRLAHTGTYTFAGSLIDIAALGASATVDPNQLKHIQDKNATKEKVVKEAQKVIKPKKVKR